MLISVFLLIDVTNFRISQERKSAHKQSSQVWFRSIKELLIHSFHYSVIQAYQPQYPSDSLKQFIFLLIFTISASEFYIQHKILLLIVLNTTTVYSVMAKESKAVVTTFSAKIFHGSQIFPLLYFIDLPLVSIWV